MKAKSSEPSTGSESASTLASPTIPVGDFRRQSNRVSLIDDRRVVGNEIDLAAGAEAGAYAFDNFYDSRLKQFSHVFIETSNTTAERNLSRNDVVRVATVNLRDANDRCAKRVSVAAHDRLQGGDDLC